MKFEIVKNPKKMISEENLHENFAYHESSQPFYKVKVLIKNLHKEPELYVNKIDKFIYKINNLKNFLKNIENINKGKIKTHAGAVSKEGKGIIFTGWQDTGKTTLMLLLAKKGYNIIADDHLEISSDFIYRVQEKAGVYPHPDNIKDLNLSFFQEIIAWFKFHFLKFIFLHSFIYPNIKISYKKIGKVKDKSKISKVLILEKGKKAILKSNVETAVNKLLSTTLDSFPLPPKGFSSALFYYYCFKNNFPVDFVIKKYKEILRKSLKGKEIFIFRGENYYDFYELFLKNEKEQY